MDQTTTPQSDELHGDSAPDRGTTEQPAAVTCTVIPTWTMSVQSLRSGMRLAENIYSQSGELLLSAGTRIASAFLEELKQRGFSYVQIGCPTPRSSAPSLRGKYERQLDDLLIRMNPDADGSGRSRSQRAARTEPYTVTQLAHEAQAHLEQHARTSQIVEGVFHDCCAGSTRLPKRVEQAVEDFVKLTTVDVDLLPLIVAMQTAEGEYLFDHCVNVSLLSMAVGAHLGLDRGKLVELGTGALLLDVGMLKISDAIRLAPRKLTADERIEVKRHTLYTLDSLQRIEGLSSVVPFVGYQVHERTDGTGYPRGRSGMFIHQYAKIAAVMDVYSAMTRPRPHRSAIPPYLAMKQILAEGSQGKLDRSVIRALLDCLSLFPVGSIVELEGGTRARVMRANPGNHTRPIVVEVDSQNEPSGMAIDLTKETSTRVVRVLANDAQPGSP